MDEESRRRARRSDPWTSHEAAALVGKFSNPHYKLIWQALEKGDGTFHELAGRCVLHFSQIHKRLPEMQDRGLCHPLDYSRKGPSGRNCRVWRIGPDPKRRKIAH